MHILILGGTGRVGSAIIPEALSRGHSVTALTRSGTSSIEPQANLILVQGTPLRSADIEAAFLAAPSARVDAVIVALKTRRSSGSPFSSAVADLPPAHCDGDGDSDAKRKPSTPAPAPLLLITETLRNLLPVMRRHGTRRVVVLSSVGAGASYAHCGLLMRLALSTPALRAGLEDHNAADELLRRGARRRGQGKGQGQGDLEYVLVRSVMQVEGDPVDVNIFSEDGAGLVSCLPRITRGSVAKFMTDAAEEPVEGSFIVGRSPVISN
jgi:hypothetical protein